jgi:hypothetical protein
MPFRRTSIRATKATGFYSPKRSRVVGSRVVGYDSDALVYINAVEAADGQALEGSVKDAYNTFVVGCKSDGIWNAIKASCIMAGARTLSGALVPLVGVAPSGFNLSSGTYSRVNGLKGDGAAMYLSSNRNNNADPQNSSHGAVYVTNEPNTGAVLASKNFVAGRNLINLNNSVPNVAFACRIQTGVTYSSVVVNKNSFVGISRSVSSSYSCRFNGVTSGVVGTSTTPDSSPIFVYCRGNSSTGAPELYTSGSLAFYSIGESLDLALLDARVSGLMVAISGAIS